MTAAHTPKHGLIGPLEAKGVRIYNGAGNLVATIAHLLDDTDAASAARIVACVNACEHISNTELAASGVRAWAISMIELKRQNAALLAALVEVTDRYERLDREWFKRDGMTYEANGSIDRARAAAKAVRS